MPLVLVGTHQHALIDSALCKVHYSSQLSGPLDGDGTTLFTATKCSDLSLCTF